MSVSLVCMSHTPLMNFTEPAAGVRDDFNALLERVRAFVTEVRPTLVVSFFPDHFNGFFYDLMPPYAVCLAARAVGDFDTASGALPVAGETGYAMARFLAERDLDVTISRGAEVDHGAVQVPALIGADEVATVPVFVNSVAPPFVPMRRIRRLGAAIGDFLAGLDERVLIIGSGGLSHDPPVPRWATATEQQREFLLAGRNPTAEARAARQARTIEAGRAYARGEGTIQELNPAWDAAFLDLCAAGDPTAFDELEADAMAEAAGNSSHEVRCWVAAFSALAAVGPFEVHERWYRAIPEWIAGFGCLTATTGAR
ncbi:3-carboxyethylcatechol 2,3-dioxygenase [Granulicoccus sp. GXG6511]|uniref:3-carboxyethylcatechol 2,3-dioxygenase n=1 Tax=Granulicoccus sp. GXG6511 TaxID=3381351 RepID=UPI003D7C95B1